MMGKIQKIVAKTDALEQRFGDGDIVDLSLIDGWNELEPEQQRYLIEFIQSFPKKTQPAMRAGISINRMRGWFNEDPNFQDVARTIKDLYSEGLHFLQFEDAKHNSKIRGQELKALDAEGWEKKSTKQSVQNQQNNIFLDGKKQGLAGLVTAFKEAKSSDKDGEVSVS